MKITRHPLIIVFSVCFLLSAFFVKTDIQKASIQPKWIEGVLLSVNDVMEKDGILTLFCGDVIVNVFYPQTDFFAGDVIRADGLLFDNRDTQKSEYPLYLMSKGYKYSLKAKKVEKISGTNVETSPLKFARRMLNSKIDRLYFRHSGIVRALVTGDRDFITKDEKDTFSKAGISHLISISGFHVLLISGIIFGSFFFLPTKLRYSVSAVFTLFYVALTGFASPSVRAYVFYVTYLMSIVLYERYDIFSIGFLLSSVYMAINPYILLDAGFCLSFLSVFSIAMFYRGIYRFIARRLKKESLKPVISLIAVTLSAQVLTFPYVCVNFGIYGTYSLPANIICVPLISFLYPFMILSLVFADIPMIASVFVNIVNFALDIFYTWLDFVVSLPFSYFETGKEHAVWLALYVAAVFLFYFVSLNLKIVSNRIDSVE